MAKSFRIDASHWFLTYPMCPTHPDDALALFQSKGKDIEQYCIAQEKHEDGSPHLHCYLLLKKRFNCRDEHFWDLGLYHGNYQAVKSPEKVLAYCKKDGNYISTFDVQAKTAAIKGKISYVCAQLLQGASLPQLVQDFPSALLQYDKLKRNLQLYKADQVPLLPRCSTFIPNTFGLVLPVLTTKQRHYWFWSASPNKGKTTFLLSLQDQFPCLWYNKEELYQLHTPNAQFVLLDEYTCKPLPVNILNSMCDSTYQYPVKGSHSFQILSSIVIVCGNRSPFDLYQESFHELLKARFLINCLDI